MADALYKDLNQFSPASREYSLDERAIYQSVINLLNTRPGERLFRPEFGIDLEAYLFDTFTQNTAQAVLNDIDTAIKRFDNRIEIDFTQSRVVANEDNNSLDLTLIFTVAGVSEQTFQIIEAIRL